MNHPLGSSARRQRQVVLLGAAGYTGRLVARRLGELGLTFDIAGRSEASLRALAEELSLDSVLLIFDAHQPDRLVASLEPGSIVVSCVGPFGLHSRELLAALARREVIYLDVCGEQSFVLDSFAHRHAEAAASGALLVHACAFESFLADLMAEAIARHDEPLREISSFYWFDRMLSSPGTQLTMRLSQHWRTVALRDGALRDEVAGAARDVAVVSGEERAVFVPYPEVIFFSRRFTTRNAASHILVRPSAVRLFNLRSAEPDLTVDEIVERHERRSRGGPSSEQRAQQRFAVIVLAETESGEQRVAKLLGRDPYGLTAAILGWACQWLLDQSVSITGVRSPAEVFRGAPFFQALASWSAFFESYDGPLLAGP